MTEVMVPEVPGCQRRIPRYIAKRACALVHLLRPVENPIPASTHIAHVLKPYMKPNGKYVTTEQQARSHLLAQLFRRRFIGGGEEDVDDGAVILSIYV